MPADQGLVDTVASDNIKTVAGQGAWALAALQNQFVKHSTFIDGLREKLMADVVTGKTDVQSAIAASKVMKADAESSLLTDLSQLAAGQESAKVAQTTPPETGVAQQLATLAAAVSSILAMLQAQSNGPAPVPAK